MLSQQRVDNRKLSNEFAAGSIRQIKRTVIAAKDKI